MDITRFAYLDKLYESKDNGMIKVLTGVRKCGKTFLFAQYKNYLNSKGVANNQIVEINFELSTYSKINTPKGLYNYILQKTVDDKMYLFIDQIYLLNGFEEALSILLKKNHYDIYLSCSNKKIFTEDFETNFDKKYQEIHLLPLSFDDYYKLNSTQEIKDAFDDYLRYGGLPHISKISDKETNMTYIEGIFNTMIVKDFIDRKKITDIDLLIRIVRYMFNSLGNPISITNMAAEFAEDGKKTNINQVNNYMQTLNDSYVIYKVDCFNIKSKLKNAELAKYYISDFGFRNSMLDYAPNKIDALENIVYLELIRRGYIVNVGKYDEYSVSFYIAKGKDKKYVQVIDSSNNKEAFLKKITPLKLIRDNLPKIVLSLNDKKSTIDNIEIENLLEWLVNGN